MQALSRIERLLSCPAMQLSDCRMCAGCDGENAAVQSWEYENKTLWTVQCVSAGSGQ